MNTPNIFTIKELRSQGWPLKGPKDDTSREWVPARPLGYQGIFLRKRIKAAWMVFTGRADVVTFE